MNKKTDLTMRELQTAKCVHIVGTEFLSSSIGSQEIGTEIGGKKQQNKHLIQKYENKYHWKELKDFKVVLSAKMKTGLRRPDIFLRRFEKHKP